MRWFGGKKSNSLKARVQYLQGRFQQAPDFTIRYFRIGKSLEQEGAIVFLKGIVDRTMVHADILRPLLIWGRQTESVDWQATESLLLSVGQIKELGNMEEGVQSLLRGDTLLLLDGLDLIYAINTRGWEKRGITEPSSEPVIRGPHDGFTETLVTNLSQIRRRLKTTRLKAKRYQVGRYSKTDVALLYLDGIANPQVIEELEKRIEQLDLDALQSSGQLEQLIEDNPYSPFPQIQSTERPDKAVANLLEGRVVLVVDGSPQVLIAPSVFSQFYQSPEDYGSRWLMATFVRLMRLGGFIVALTLPAIYIALISFNYEMIPLRLLIPLAESRSRVPFPPIVEAMLMEITIELLREAGIRLPSPIGQTIGIVGGLVVGQAAVQAGLVSNVMVIVVAVTAIASFVVPTYDVGFSVRLLRFPLMFLAAAFGLVGIAVGLTMLLAHLAILESVGTPYALGISPLRLKDWLDSAIRAPSWFLNQRPTIGHPLNRTRQQTGKGEKKHE